MAEDLSTYLKEKKINAAYLHSDIKTLERSNILENLRKGNFNLKFYLEKFILNF